jgi:RNA methyltransferase, TrmH family
MAVHEKVITSRDNPLVKLSRQVRDGKERGMIFLEGLRLCEEAVRSSLKIEAALFTDEFQQSPKGAELIKLLADSIQNLARAQEGVIRSVSDTQAPQGIVILAKRPDSSLESFSKALTDSPLLVVLDKVSNPSNAGSILRTAEAAGANGTVSIKGSADLFSPKALRGSMGSALRLPVWTGASFEEVESLFNQKGITLVAADANATRSYLDFNWKRPAALLMGGETGFEQSASTVAERVFIPMSSSVESLNVAVACGVILYEAFRQRSKA